MRQTCPVTLEATINNQKIEAMGDVDIEQFMSDYCKELYKDEKMKVPAWLLDASSCPEKDTCELAERIFDVKNLQEAITLMKPEASGSDDGIVVNMIRALPEEALSLLGELFCQRLVRMNVEKGRNKLDPEDGWRKLHSILLPKVLSPGSLEQYRPITVMSVVAKVYYKCMAMHVSSVTRDKL